MTFSESSEDESSSYDSTDSDTEHDENFTDTQINTTKNRVIRPPRQKQ